MGPVPHPFRDRWNHNTHYYPLLAERLRDATTVLDLGCGDGTFVRFLSRPGRVVAGLDADVAVLPADGRHVAGSLLNLPFADESLDGVSVVMALHHVPISPALNEARRVLRPGGVLVILGYGRSTGFTDRVVELRDLAAHRWHRRGKTEWEPPTAKAEPSDTWRATHAELVRELPGAHYRRLPMWRYLLRWRAPVS